jgi:hypothetical protein
MCLGVASSNDHMRAHRRIRLEAKAYAIEVCVPASLSRKNSDSAVPPSNSFDAACLLHGRCAWLISVPAFARDRIQYFAVAEFDCHRQRAPRRTLVGAKSNPEALLLRKW